MDKIVLIDGNNILNRAFFGLPSSMITSKGLHTNGVLGFLHILFKILDEEKPDYLAVAFDVDKKTFRHLAYDDYKAQRKPADPALLEQFPMIEEMLRRMGICIVKKSGYEADDIMGTIAKRAESLGIATSLVSGDKDLIQVAGGLIKVRVPITAKGRTTVKDYDRESFKEDYGLDDPAMMIELKALMGDTSDNYKGVKGIGPKTATDLLIKYGSLDGIYEHIDEITGKNRERLIEDRESAYFSRFLATIKTDCELDFEFDDARLGNIFTEEARIYCKELELKSMLPYFTKKPVDVDPITADIEEENPFTNPTLHSGYDDPFGTFGADQQVNVNDTAAANDTDEISVETLSDISGFEKRVGELADSVSKNIGFSFTLHMNSDGFTYEIGTVSFATDKETIFFGPDDLSEDSIVSAFKKLAGVGKKLYGFDIHNAAEKFEEIRKSVFDLSIGAYLVYPGKNSYTPADVARDFLGIRLSEPAEVFGKMSVEEAWMNDDLLGTNRKKAGALLSTYARTAFLAVEAVTDKLCSFDLYNLYENVEMPLVFALRDMEIAGITVDRDALVAYGKDLVGKIKELEKKIYALCGIEFNINSPKQLGEVLFEKLKLPGGKKTKTGYSTSADVLEKLRSDEPAVGMILSYRELSKLKSTYADGLFAFICSDGRIHTKFNQTVTATGRLSSTDPNLQNIPVRKELGREIRKMFVPKSGCCFIDADYSQIELRLLAHMSGDGSLIEAYGKGADIHTITAAGVFGVDVSEVTPAMRNSCKAVNFGIIYGMSSFGLGQEINVSRKEAEEYIARYFETYPGIKSYLDRLVDDVRARGFSKTLFGRRRPIPDIKSTNYMIRQGAERIAMNSPIQGTAADIMKIALNNVYYALKKEGLSGKILLQVHDELLLEVPVEEKERTEEVLKREMMNAADLSVKLAVSVGSGENWDEAH